MDVSVDLTLKERVRSVLDGRLVTEAELRTLFEQGRACALILEGRLAKGERRLSDLAARPESSLAELAAAMREVGELRPRRDELCDLLEALEGRAREFRASWVSSA